MLEAPVGLALFGPDMRFRWVNAALARLGGSAGSDGSAPSDSSAAADAASPDSVGWAGLLPSQAWPEPIATRAENALREVLAKGVPLAEAAVPRGPGARRRCPSGRCPRRRSSRWWIFPAWMPPPPIAPVADAGYPGEAAETGITSGCASWFPVHDAAGQVFGVGLIMLNMACPPAGAAEAAAAADAAAESSAARSVTARWSWVAPRWSGWRRRTAR